MSILKERKELFDSFIESVNGNPNSKEESTVAGKSSIDKDVTELLLSDLETKMLEII